MHLLLLPRLFLLIDWISEPSCCFTDGPPTKKRHTPKKGGARVRRPLDGKATSAICSKTPKRTYPEAFVNALSEVDLPIKADKNSSIGYSRTLDISTFKNKSSHARRARCCGLCVCLYRIYESISGERLSCPALNFTKRRYFPVGVQHHGKQSPNVDRRIVAK